MLLPKSPMGKAIGYALNQWDALMRYTDNPLLDIDNNISERVLRMVVLGRKNFLFAGSETGAQRAAILYSLVASCKLHQLDPFAYFADVLKRVSTHPAGKIDELLPGEWKKTHAQATNCHRAVQNGPRRGESKSTTWGKKYHSFSFWQALFFSR